MSDEEKEAIEKLEKEIDNIKISILGFERDIDDKDWLEKVTRELKNDISAREIVLNIIKKQQKELEELKEESKEYQIGFAQGCYEKDLDWEDKIEATIGPKMQENNNIIHNAKLKYGKDYVYYDEVGYARETNRIYKEIWQSLLEKE